jgi:phosphoglycolate phosphatase-like HAD superfamily hydrolase
MAAIHALPNPRHLVRSPVNGPAAVVWLFDVDGTLLLTDGAGRDAMAHAIFEVFGIADDLRDVPFAGRTDPLIVADALRKHALGFRDGTERRFYDAMVARMAAELAPGRGRILPGVADTLAALGAAPGHTLGLLTGNIAAMARLKLAHFGLERCFAFGAFGDDGPDRDAVARVAVERAAERVGVSPDRCVVVGDTEHDVACARAAGARAVAVATGWRSRAELEAVGADLVLDDLRDAHALLAFAGALADR